MTTDSSPTDTTDTTDTSDRSRGRQFLADLRPGERFEEALVVQNVQVGLKKDGEPFLSMLVSDRSAQYPARWWGVGEAMASRLPDPGILRVKGTVKNFNGSVQIHIDRVVAAGGGVDTAELLPSAERDAGEMFADVRALLGSVTDAHLKTLCDMYLDDAGLMDRFKRAPAAMSFHHAYLGGLLEHTLNMMRIADRVCDLFPGVSRDLVVVGAFLHDMGKTSELSYETGFDYTDAGRLVGHLVQGTLLLHDKVRQAADAGRTVSQEVVDVLHHLLLSHHGPTDRPFGSARDPMTPEAWALHLIDNLDAKLNISLAACRSSHQADGARWTEHLRAMGTRMFRPDVTAAGTADDASPAR